MVVMDLSEMLSERGVPLRVHPRHFVVIDTENRLYVAAKKRRFNPQSADSIPEGFVLCDPPCKLLAKIEFDEGLATCPHGHEVDLVEEAHREFENPGGNTRVGLTLKEQGDIGELLIQEIEDLDTWGHIQGWCEEYNSPLDGITDLGWGIEVKTRSTRAKSLAFSPGKADCRLRKRREAKLRGLKGILEILVVLDFENSVARIYIQARRIREDLKYWSIPLEPPFREVSFEHLNPFVKRASEPEGLPF
jgi:hypothetical protein